MCGVVVSNFWYANDGWINHVGNDMDGMANLDGFKNVCTIAMF
jgi:hypothetical protein